MQKDKNELVCGVLDIYGFEIFMVSYILLHNYIAVSQERVHGWCTSL